MIHCRWWFLFFFWGGGNSLLAGIFPFQLPWDDSLQNATDLSWLNHRPAGIYGPVHTGSDGHLYAGSQRIRFLGLNFTQKSNMPEKAEASKIAARLAKFGINIIRFHLMDADWGEGGSIFDPSFPGTRHLSPAALDKLDYFISQLKARGIYADLNLLTGRMFTAADGLNSVIDGMDWKDRQIPAMFDRKMIDLQKEYASHLLEHLNPYTSLVYKNDPAVAIIEVINEQGLLHAWRDGKIDLLPAFYASELQSDWNQFLITKYSTHAQLAAAWTRTSPGGDELLLNRNFSSQLQNWNVEQHNGAVVNSSVTNDGPSSTPAAKLQVTNTSATDWHVQFNQANLHVNNSTVYTLSFWAKADRIKNIMVEIMQAHDPWAGLGFNKEIALTTGWQKFSFTLNLSGTDSNARLNFRGMGDVLATYWFSSFSLAPGGTLGLFSGENLDQRNIRLIFLQEQGERLETASQDFARFLWEKEESYWREMRDHVKNSLGAQALMMGTVVGNSTPNLMSLFDIIDSHSYWQHPSFEISWGSPWWIRNSSLLGEADGGTISALALKRVQGKPFSVSEYNHPYPSSFGTEGFIILASYAALQDWDAIFAYTYADGTLNWSEDRQSGYFDLQHDPGKMIALRQAALLFRRSDVSAASQLVSVSMNKEEEIRSLPASGSWRLVDAEYAGLNRRIGLLNRISLCVNNESMPSEALDPSTINIPATGRFTSDTGQLDWDSTNRVLQINTGNSKGVIGYTIGKSYTMNGFVFRPSASLQNWAVLALTAVPPPARAPLALRFLLSSIGLVQNSNQQWQYYPSNQPAGFPPPADANLTLGNWGTAPVQAEGIAAEVVIPYPAARVRVYALDGTGSRKQPVPVADAAGQAKFQISDSYQTLWYEIIVSPPASVLTKRTR